jgi:hypothetical protein
MASNSARHTSHRCHPLSRLHVARSTPSISRPTATTTATFRTCTWLRASNPSNRERCACTTAAAYTTTGSSVGIRPVPSRNRRTHPARLRRPAPSVPAHATSPKPPRKRNAHPTTSHSKPARDPSSSSASISVPKHPASKLNPQTFSSRDQRLSYHSPKHQCDHEREPDRPAAFDFSSTTASARRSVTRRLGFCTGGAARRWTSRYSQRQDWFRRRGYAGAPPARSCLYHMISSFIFT